MLRKAVFKNTDAHKTGFNLRGREVLRIETFSDGVFAFAVTLLIVSLEVPKSFEELLTTMRGFAPFGICFALLMFIWHEQNVFFRRYGLEDGITIVLNSALMFIVLFYVYPLKFLFTLVFSDGIYGAGKSPFIINGQQVPLLMVIYGVGFVIIYVIFLLMYLHASRNKVKLQLTEIELFDTRTKIFAHVIFIAVGAVAICLAMLLPMPLSGISGYTYCLLSIACWIYFDRRAKMRVKLHRSEGHAVTATNGDTL